MPSQIKNPFAKLSAKGDSSAEKEDIRSTKFASSLEASANKFKDKMASLRTKASNSSAESDVEPEGEDIISFHFEGDDEGGGAVAREALLRRSGRPRGVRSRGGHAWGSKTPPARELCVTAALAGARAWSSLVSFELRNGT